MTTAGNRTGRSGASFCSSKSGIIHHIIQQLPSPYHPRTCVAVAGNDYCIVAASTRLSTGYSILTRDGSRILKLYGLTITVSLIHSQHNTVLLLLTTRSDKVFIASAGMQADMKTLHKMLHTRQVMYQYNNRKPLSANATAQLLSNTLYFKRFFPYYTFNIVAGLDDEGGFVCLFLEGVTMTCVVCVEYIRHWFTLHIFTTPPPVLQARVLYTHMMLLAHMSVWAMHARCVYVMGLL